ncbi:MAG: hypothetical protein EPO08_03480 [Rhodospirillaceae bacterium]|nr:MAG: hypothetical protein EPO08_03480 [Rhodospirillaceae bacterium]
MSGYREFRHYSPLMGCEAARLSMVDERGGEFYCIVPVEYPARLYRERRDVALDALEAAIMARREPGEVTV